VFKASLLTREGKREVAIVAYIGAAKEAELRITPLGMPSTSTGPIQVTLLAATGGLIQSSVEVSGSVANAMVELGWDTGDGFRVNVSRETTDSAGVTPAK
jgi:hypothetical protein